MATLASQPKSPGPEPEPRPARKIVSRQRRGPRRLFIVLGVLVLLVVVFRLVLDPIAAYGTRKGLAKMDGFRGEFDHVHVTLFGPGYTISRLKLIEDPGGSWKAPIFYAESVHMSIDWRRLLHRQILAAVRIVEPKVEILSTKKTAMKVPDLSAQLQNVTPLKLARVEIIGGEILFRDLTEERHPELWVHKLDLAAENLPTREKFAGARPTTISARGMLGRSGQLSLFVSADPFASPLAFAGRFELRDLRVAELYDFIEPKTKVQVPRGTVDLFAEFTVKNGRVDGGVKPVLKNVEVRPVESGAWDHFKAWLVDKAVKLASDRVPGRNAVATVVPLEGPLTDPDVQLWPAVFGVVRNAFVEGVASGFSNLPPEKSGQTQGVISQAKAALKKDDGPPKAQPVKATPPNAPRSAVPSSVHKGQSAPQTAPSPKASP
jgi:Domain of Unknown Function (DUF748)